ncbi:ankyrin-3-like isoform X1 [Solea senegalensis]|uniref:Ankyrin-3-like isoform X1 n=1 Tax=Solea senegalensis TaxID=28829 RepID=A0AAV6RXN2_SOLSE|nr:ankyrin-3-like isoform X1 [Solea senegalensis]
MTLKEEEVFCKRIRPLGLDFDPWSSKGAEEEVVVDMGGMQGVNGEPKPFGLAVDEQSQATTPDTTPARTPTDDSTPTSEPNPFPFHEGKMFEMTRSGAIDMSKRDMVEERLQFFQIGPQSPCERTDLRMAIVADHLGLSWTELARELEFSVEEINFIRVENPNSLTAQSFMLLKKWVHRDGKNATTDALTTALTKINRLDIVTLLEGPIFDYGNISGTRCFADDNAVFPDQSDVSLQLRMSKILRVSAQRARHQCHVFHKQGSYKHNRLFLNLVNLYPHLHKVTCGPKLLPWNYDGANVTNKIILILTDRDDSKTLLEATDHSFFLREMQISSNKAIAALYTDMKAAYIEKLFQHVRHHSGPLELTWL